jgi:COP9 signalosome complex subunit 6
MDIDGAAQSKALKFRELVYTIETGEVEMISVDFVARGGGNATAVEGAPAPALKVESSKADEDIKKGKGKQKEKQKEESTIDEAVALTAEDEERK